MKICKYCHRDQPEENYHWNDKGKGRRSPKCMDCTHQHYQETRDKHREKVRRRLQKNRAIVFENQMEYLREHPCMDCGTTDLVVLEFDHRDPSKKSQNVSEMATRGSHSWARILEEIEKCDVVCANCHRRRTVVQQNHRRAQFL